MRPGPAGRTPPDRGSTRAGIRALHLPSLDALSTGTPSRAGRLGRFAPAASSRGPRLPSHHAVGGVRPPSVGHAAVAVRAEPACFRPPFGPGASPFSCGAYRASTPLRGVEAREAAHPRGGGGRAALARISLCTGGDTMAPMGDVQPPVGYSDLLVMPDDGRRYEIHGGELVVVPSPMPAHQIVAVGDPHAAERLPAEVRRAGPWWRRSTSSSTSTTSSSRTSLFFRAERRQLVQPFAVTRGGAGHRRGGALAVDRGCRPGRKMRMFAHYGVPEVWIRRPRRRADRSARSRRRCVPAGADGVGGRHRAVGPASGSDFRRRPRLHFRVAGPARTANLDRVCRDRRRRAVRGTTSSRPNRRIGLVFPVWRSTAAPLPAASPPATAEAARSDDRSASCKSCDVIERFARCAKPVGCMRGESVAPDTAAASRLPPARP